MIPPRLHHPSLGRRGCALVAVAWLGLPLAGMAGTEPARDPLASGFLQPPHDAHPKTFWHWMNDSVTKEGITADLEAMSRSGIGGAQVIYAALRNRDTQRFVAPAPAYLSPEWLELVRFTASEAKRLNLEVGFQNCPGASESGGPGVTPDQGMQHVVWSELQVTGGRKLAVPVPRPEVHYGFMHGVAASTPPKSFFGVEPPDVAKYYRDIALIAFPTPAGEQEPAPTPVRITSNTLLQHPASLCDHDGDTSETFPLPAAGSPVWIEYAYAAPITVRSAVISCVGNNSYRDGELQCSDDGAAWRIVGPLAKITMWDRFAPCTTAVPETRARFFRFSFTAAMDFAKRLDLAELRLSSLARLNHWEIKAAYVPAMLAADGSLPVARPEIIAPGRIIDLTGMLRPDGSVDWTVPPGNWTILRVGYAPMGIQNRSGLMAEAAGLEVDKLDRAAVEKFFADGPARIIAAAGPLAGTTLSYMFMDSWEVFTENWTPRFLAEFSRRRGYDPRPWLPVMTGRIVGDATLSERFLFDVRHTLSDLVVENHYGTFAELVHRSGLKLYAEAPGHAGPTVADAFATKGRVDVPMGEFWLGRMLDSRDAKQAAASAQLYGQRIVATESFTSVPEESNWQESPANLKTIGDHYFAAGINQFVFHTSVHQPWLDRPPGLTLLMYGSHFERTNGWLEVAGPPWISYLSRSQFLLQRGLPVADVNFFVGEDAPNDLPGPDDAGLRSVLPVGHDYGGCSADGLLRRMSVRDGRIVLPDGMSFAVLVLPTRPELSLPAARKLRDLVEAGATVVGPRPLRSPSLSDFPQGDEEIRRIGDKVWGAVDGGKITEHRFGQGRVVWGRPLATVLPPPDFDYDRTTGTNLVFTHRRDGDTEIYFVANQGPAAMVAATFRVSGKQPELWDAETGEIAPVRTWVEHDGRITVPLQLGEMGSIFVVFRRPASSDAVVKVERNSAPAPLTALLQPEAGTYHLTTTAGKQLRGEVKAAPAPISIEGPWAVQFPAATGATAPFTWSPLVSWTDDSHPDLIRYFSGTAIYSADFVMPATALPANCRVQLDLGRVEKFAGLTLNGRPLRVLWHAPYVMDVTAAVQPGQNHLEVAVTNLLVNRLIGDQQRPENERRMWSTHQPYTKDSPLLPSGLLGPVRLVIQPQLTLAP